MTGLNTNIAYGNSDAAYMLERMSEQDDIWGGLGAARLAMAEAHKNLINKALLAETCETPLNYP